MDSIGRSCLPKTVGVPNPLNGVGYDHRGAGKEAGVDAGIQGAPTPGPPKAALLVGAAPRVITPHEHTAALRAPWSRAGRGRT